MTRKQFFLTLSVVIISSSLGVFLRSNFYLWSLARLDKLVVVLLAVAMEYKQLAFRQISG